MLTKQVVLAFILHLAAEAHEAKVEPTQLLDWSTGWGGLDPGEQGKVEKMVQDAKDREEVARKELMEARADEQKAQEMAQSKHAKGGESQPSTVYPVHSKLVHAPIPTMEEVTAAKHRADEEEKRAAAAQQTAKLHLQKAEAAAKEASRSSDDRQREKAQKEAKSEAALATEAEHNATVKRLEAKIAHDKVRFMEIQSLRGGWQTESPSQWVEYASVGAGIFALALCAFLVPGRSKTAKQEPLKEPLLTEEPDWARESGDEEHSAEEWKQRAVAALERSRKSQEEMAGVKADAEVTKAQHAEQVAALEAKLKAEAETTQSALSQKVTALEQKVEESQMALQAKSDEAAAAKQSLEDFKSQMAQADSHSAGMVDALREREEKLAAAHAETALLTERLQLAQENLDRTKKECLSAQAAAEEAQNMYQHALSKVDLNAEEEKARADLKQKSLSAAEQELEQAKQEVSNLSEQMENSGHKFEMERQKSVGLNEALAVTQSQVKDLLAKVSSVTSASEVLQQEKATAEEKIAALEKEEAPVMMRREARGSLLLAGNLDGDVPTKWPDRVMNLFREAGQQHTVESQGLRPLHLVCGASQKPHPEKAATGGEDSLFICPNGSAAGVADGVGSMHNWGIDPKPFADKLMATARETALDLSTEVLVDVQTKASICLRDSYKAVKKSGIFGSATALVAALDPSEAKLGVANLGDSGLRILRWSDGFSGKPRGVYIAERTSEQQHDFNTPYQLSFLPKELVLKSEGRREDLPSDCQTYTFEVREGDVVLLGTDGIFDNLHDWEICDLATIAMEAMKEGEHIDPQRLADAFAQVARWRSEDPKATTPFQIQAQNHGLRFPGGKVDDITVATCVVQS